MGFERGLIGIPRHSDGSWYIGVPIGTLDREITFMKSRCMHVDHDENKPTRCLHLRDECMVARMIMNKPVACTFAMNAWWPG